MIVGITIGSGIFRKPQTLAGLVPDAVVILALWTGFGLISLCGALALAELASMLPRTGGPYVFIHAAYGPAAAFVFGWLYLLVATPAAIGALATFFAELLLDLVGPVPRDPGAVPVLASITIAVLTAANVRGTRLGTTIQGTLTVLKVSALLLVMGAGFLAGGSFAHLAERSPTGVESDALGRAAASVIWAYDGWIAVSMIAGEVVGAEKRMRHIVVAGMLAIVLLYLGANVAYFYAMPVAAMAHGHMRECPSGSRHGSWGPAGAAFISVLDPLQRVRRVERQRARQAPGLVRPRPRRPHLRVPGAGPPALVDAARGHPHSMRGGGLARLAPPRLRSHHDLLRGGGVGGAAVRGGRRSSSCVGACPTRRGPSARPAIPGFPRCSW